MSQNNLIFLKFKGLTKTEQNKLSPSFFYSFFDEKQGLTKPHVIVRSNFFYKEFLSLSLLKRNVLIKLKISLDKRLKLYKNKKWVSTTPVHTHM